MRTRIYNKLNVKEIQSYLDRGGDTIFLPCGVIECHGALPVDCETICPQAFAVLLAEKVDGLVLTDLPYFYAGGTVISDTTIHMSIRDGIDFLHKLCKSLVQQGFKRIYLLDTHGPANLTCVAFARDFYEKTGIHPCHIRCGNLVRNYLTSLNLPKDEILAGIQKMFFGAYKVMGLEQYLAVDPSADNSIFTSQPIDEAALRFENALVPLGCVPSRLFSAEEQHSCGDVFLTTAQRDAVCAEGEALIRAAVDAADIMTLHNALAEYQEYTRNVVNGSPRLQKLFSDL